MGSACLDQSGVNSSYCDNQTTTASCSSGPHTPASVSHEYLTPQPPLPPPAPFTAQTSTGAAGAQTGLAHVTDWTHVHLGSNPAHATFLHHVIISEKNLRKVRYEMKQAKPAGLFFSDCIFKLIDVGFHSILHEFSQKLKLSSLEGQKDLKSYVGKDIRSKEQDLNFYILFPLWRMIIFDLILPFSKLSMSKFWIFFFYILFLLPFRIQSNSD